MAKQHKITPTFKEETSSENVAPMLAPVEMNFTVAAANVQKYQTPNGLMTVLSLISPIGMSVSVQLSEDNVKELVDNLQENPSSIETFAALPPGIIGAKS